MALDGASREEIEAHLAESYDARRRSDALLDDVLAREEPIGPQLRAARRRTL